MYWLLSTQLVRVSVCVCAIATLLWTYGKHSRHGRQHMLLFFKCVPLPQFISIWAVAFTMMEGIHIPAVTLCSWSAFWNLLIRAAQYFHHAGTLHVPVIFHYVFALLVLLLHTHFWLCIWTIPECIVCDSIVSTASDHAKAAAYLCLNVLSLTLLCRLVAKIFFFWIVQGILAGHKIGQICCFYFGSRFLLTWWCGWWLKASVPLA